MIIIILSLTIKMTWKLFQFDVKLIFFNGYLNVDVYVEKPQGSITNEGEREQSL